jgi:hypothetical protein
MRPCQVIPSAVHVTHGDQWVQRVASAAAQQVLGGFAHRRGWRRPHRCSPRMGRAAPHYPAPRGVHGGRRTRGSTSSSPASSRPGYSCASGTVPGNRVRGRLAAPHHQGGRCDLVLGGKLAADLTPAETAPPLEPAEHDSGAGGDLPPRRPGRRVSGPYPALLRERSSRGSRCRLGSGRTPRKSRPARCATSAAQRTPTTAPPAHCTAAHPGRTRDGERLHAVARLMALTGNGSGYLAFASITLVANLVALATAVAGLRLA